MKIIVLFLLTNCAQNHISRKVAGDNLFSEYSTQRVSNHQAKCESLSTTQDHFEEWNKIGICYNLSGQHTKAKFFFQIALTKAESKKQKAVIQNNLGLVYLFNNNFNLAIEHFNLAEKEHKNPVVQYNKALLYLYFHHATIAKKIFLELHLISPEDPDLNFNLAQVYLLENNIPESLKYIHSLPDNYKNKQYVQNLIATLHFKQGNTFLAQTTLEAANETTIPFIRQSTLDLLKFIRHTKQGN
jgi:Flp pilus assembly protein TadD